MKIANVYLGKGSPDILDDIQIEDTDGNIYTISHPQLEQWLIEDGQLCEHCLGTGEVEEGQHDDIRTKKCICRTPDEE